MPPPVPATAGLDFINALSAATTGPTRGGGDGKDLPDGFPAAGMEGHRVIDSSKEEGIDGMSVYDYTPFQKVFVIFRQWGTCNRCSNAIASQKVVLPDDEGDITCPHTQLRELEEVRRQGMQGQLILGTEQETVMRDGSIVVSLKWFVPKINHRRQRALVKALEKRAASQSSEDMPSDD